MPASTGVDFRTVNSQEYERARITPQMSLKEVARLQMKATLAAKESISTGSHRLAEGADYGYFTFDQCRKAGNSVKQDDYGILVRNHFAYCLLARPRYTFYVKRGPARVEIGHYTFRMAVIGKGQRGAQRMEFEMELDNWNAYDAVSPMAPLKADMVCLSYANASCSDTNFGGRDDSVGGWKTNGYYRVAFDASQSVGGQDGIHYDFDRVNYHDLFLSLIGEESDDKLIYQYPFRCDAAEYASGGGCIYHDIASVLHYARTGQGIDDVAAHIRDAQNDPQHIKPGGVGTDIPGKIGGGKPLTRLQKSIDPEANTYANRASDIIYRDCQKYWTDAERANKQCDEYPFNSTWENAAYAEAHPGEKWKYSVRPVDPTQNGYAGNILRSWYFDDHVLAKDPFWVQID